MKTTEELVIETAAALKEYGYDVYLSKDFQNRSYGFFTNGKRVVSFRRDWGFSLVFSGHYVPSYTAGSGWKIADGQGVPTPEEAARWLAEPAPSWANKSPIYITPERYLSLYGTLFNDNEILKLKKI